MIRRIIILVLMASLCSVGYAADLAFKDGLKHYLKGEIGQAIQIWTELGEKGDIQAQKQLGQFYLTDRDQRDYQKSIDWYSRAVSQGDREADSNLKNAEAQLVIWKQLANELGSRGAYNTIAFREHLTEGDDTHCGFIIEVKSKVVLIQTSKDTRWFKKENLYPPDTKQCAY